MHHNNRNNCSCLTNFEFKLHCDDDSKYWECDNCCSESILTLPFSHLEENNWFNFNEIHTKQSCDNFNIITADANDFVLQCDSIHNLINSEIDDEDILSTHVNSKYYDIDQINSLKTDLSSSFGMFHVNIASLNLHIDDLKQILSLLNYKFDIIGISEHKILKDTLPSNNILIPGYNEFIFEPKETTHGGTGFYIKDNINYIIRKDLQINSPGDFESIFIEIQIPNKKNLIVGCVYRHPSSKISIHNFTNLHLDPVLQKISAENKQCVLMGDFNVDLLKIDSHNDSNLSSHFFYSIYFTTYKVTF